MCRGDRKFRIENLGSRPGATSRLPGQETSEGKPTCSRAFRHRHPPQSSSQEHLSSVAISSSDLYASITSRRPAYKASHCFQSSKHAVAPSFWLGPTWRHSHTPAHLDSKSGPFFADNAPPTSIHSFIAAILCSYAPTATTLLLCLDVLYVPCHRHTRTHRGRRPAPWNPKMKDLVGQTKARRCTPSLLKNFKRGLLRSKIVRNRIYGLAQTMHRIVALQLIR